jgi:hypothetical protein
MRANQIKRIYLKSSLGGLSVQGRFFRIYNTAPNVTMRKEVNLQVLKSI